MVRLKRSNKNETANKTVAESSFSAGVELRATFEQQRGFPEEAVCKTMGSTY
jgi:hypothetical protein